jgi:hypothetical protein
MTELQDGWITPSAQEINILSGQNDRQHPKNPCNNIGMDFMQLYRQKIYIIQYCIYIFRGKVKFCVPKVTDLQPFTVTVFPAHQRSFERDL